MTKGIQQYLDLPAKELLEKFGEGRHVPGSGSAAALSALLATELMITVCKLTQRKEGYSRVHKDFEYIQNQIETVYKPKLIDLFNNDIVVFGEVSDIRMRRDAEVSAVENVSYPFWQRKN